MPCMPFAPLISPPAPRLHRGWEGHRDTVLRACWSDLHDSLSCWQADKGGICLQCPLHSSMSRMWHRNGRSRIGSPQWTGSSIVSEQTLPQRRTGLLPQLQHHVHTVMQGLCQLQGSRVESVRPERNFALEVLWVQFADLGSMCLEHLQSA